MCRGLLNRVGEERPSIKQILALDFLRDAGREVDQAYDAEAAARVPELPFGEDEFELRALEDNPAADRAAAALCGETLAQCRAERATVRGERAAEKKAEDRKKGMRAPGMVVTGPSLNSGRAHSLFCP